MQLRQSLHKRLKQRALDTDRSLYEVTEEAITQYLNPDKDESADIDPDVEMLLEFKEIAKEEDILGLRQNIVVFLRDARREAAARKRRGA